VAASLRRCGEGSPDTSSTGAPKPRELTASGRRVSLASGFLPVFTFSTKTTFIYEIEEEVRTGQLEIRCDNELVLNIGVSCADDADGRPEWVARSVEVFCDGEWVADLLGLAARQQAHERQRLQLETRERQRHAQELTELRQRFGIEDAAPAAGQAKAISKEPQGRRWLRFWRKSSG